MDSSPYSYDDGQEYEPLFYDGGYDSSSVSRCNFDGISEISDECYSIYEQSLSDSYFEDYDDELSSNFSCFETDSSLYDYQSETTTTSGSTPERSMKSRFKDTDDKPVLNGILKRTNNSNTYNESISTPITQATIDKIRESEFEDILQYARDIVNPDPAAKLTFSSQPAKVVQGSFRHLLSVKEINSNNGAFKYRTVEITRNGEEDLGISIRKGDGWEKKDGIYISRVALGSIFDQYEILTVGDEVIKINKVDVKKMNVDDVIRLMHIPEKLSVTIKLLTPFSRKRVEKSGINKFRLEQKKFVGGGSMDDTNRFAHLRIKSNGRKTFEKPKRTILVRNKTTQQKEQKQSKISPYRTMEGGRIVPTAKNALSPVRECHSESNLSQNNRPRRQSYVTWSDQRCITSEPF